MLKRLGKILLGLVAFLVVLYGVLVILSKPIPEHPFFEGQGVLVMSHRGGRGLWPENTLYAFEGAVELGVDILEMDLHSTKDGALVVMHDSTVDRTTNGTGPIHDFTLAELRELDAGYQWSPDDGQSYPFRGQGITVPTLDEIFTAFPDKRMNIEIKQAQPSIVVHLCKMVRDYGMTEQVLFASFHAETMKEFRRVCPEVAASTVEDEVRILYVLSLGYLEAIYPAPAQALQVPEYSGSLQVVTQRFVDAAHSCNMDVHVWTVNDVGDMQRMLGLGVDGIITDYPDILLALLGR